MDKKTIVIAAFPGCGKSTFFKKNKNICIDSDSSLFDKEHFPENYMQHIKNNIGKVDYIFVSTHAIVRKALVDNAIPFVCVVPFVTRRKEFVTNYISRGSSESLIAVIEKNWMDWIMDCGNKLFNDNAIYTMKTGYIEDNLSNIIEEYKKYYNV